MPKAKQPELLSAGQLAWLLRVDLTTIHGWVDKGLLSSPERTLGGHRRFDPKRVRDDIVRNEKPIPERLTAFLRGELRLDTTVDRAIARASTEQLRAELARREERGAA